MRIIKLPNILSHESTYLRVEKLRSRNMQVDAYCIDMAAELRL